MAEDPLPEGSYAFCYRCGYAWVPKTAARSKRCPRCHSSRWDVPEKRDRACKFCGFVWRMESKDDPCPHCGHRQTEGLNDRSLHCNQCDYEWRRRGPGRPKKCPLCHSTEWDRPAVRKLVCQQCGHLWRSRTATPERCPQCQSQLWNQPLKVVRCQRCGHVWKMRADRGKGIRTVCPHCRTAEWDKSPRTYTCLQCGRTYILRKEHDEGRCPICDQHSRPRNLIVCASCGRQWYGDARASEQCPTCGALTSPKDRPNATSMTLWKDGREELTYLSENGLGFVYLWEDGVPVTARYMSEVYRRFHRDIGQIVEAVNTGELDGEWREFADDLRRNQNGYERFIDYFQKRLSLSADDAVILSLHFTGMNAESIAKKLGRGNKEVSDAFDRIMKAYSDSGIIVDDTIFTEDPFKFY